MNNTEKNILKGCGSHWSDIMPWVVCIEDELCPSCKSKLEGYQLAQKENYNQLPTSSNKDTGENNQVADERRKLNHEKGRLYSSNSESSSPEMELKASSVGSNNIEKYKKETAEKVEEWVENVKARSNSNNPFYEVYDSDFMILKEVFKEKTE